MPPNGDTKGAAMKRGLGIAAILLLGTSGGFAAGAAGAAGSAPDMAKTHFERSNCHNAYDLLSEDLDANRSIGAAEVAWAKAYEAAAGAKTPCPQAPESLLTRAANRTVVTKAGLGKVGAYLDNGDATAMFEAANAVLTGKFTGVGPEVGWQLLKQSADLGQPSALFFLGSLHVGGLFTQNKADYASGRPLIERAALAGHVDALFMIANMYKDGIGGKKDAAKAFEFYRQAAERGHTYAALMAFTMINDGEGTRKDFALAYRIARNMAGQGEVYGAVMAASALLQSKDATKHKDEVLYWMDIAIRDGDETIRSQVIPLRAKALEIYNRPPPPPPEYRPRAFKACGTKTVCLVNSSGVQWSCTTNKDYWSDCDG